MKSDQPEARQNTFPFSKTVNKPATAAAANTATGWSRSKQRREGQLIREKKRRTFRRERKTSRVLSRRTRRQHKQGEGRGGKVERWREEQRRRQAKMRPNADGHGVGTATADSACSPLGSAGGIPPPRYLDVSNFNSGLHPHPLISLSLHQSLTMQTARQSWG